MPDAPSGLTATERVSFIGYDAEKTHRFCTEVLRLPLIDARTANDERGREYLETQYALADGSTLAYTFYDEPPDEAQQLHPLRHFAFEVRDVEMLRAWKAHFVACGVPVVGEIDHGAVMSIYFFDPNEIRLELSTNLIAFDDEEARKAQDIYDRWKQVGTTEQHTPVGGLGAHRG
jgi:glyoxylase I family protein